MLLMPSQPKSNLHFAHWALCLGVDLGVWRSVPPVGQVPTGIYADHR